MVRMGGRGEKRGRSEGYSIKLGGFGGTRVRRELDEYRWNYDESIRACIAVEICIYAYGARSIWTSNHWSLCLDLSIGQYPLLEPSYFY